MALLKNNNVSYSVLAKVFHWITAIAVFGLFALGYWMVSLGYYHTWYQRAPKLHISFGVLLAVVVIARLGYRLWVAYPPALPNHSAWESMAAKLVHGVMYFLLLVMVITGYVTVTGQGDPVSVFDWFEIPALFNGGKSAVDWAGDVHELAAYALVGLASLHALAALKHHFFDKDDTLRRIITRSRQ